MQKNLVTAEKQAYEGAKMFYNCFLPTIIGMVTIFNLIQSLSNIFIHILLVTTYFTANIFYKRCHEIDTYIKIQPVSIPQQQFKSNQNNEQEKQREQIKSIGIELTQQSYISDTLRIRQQQHFQLEQLTQIAQINSKPQKFNCNICKITIPYRSRHCYKCRRCVIKYDHHCFWIGNCVGANNHREFYIFLFLQTIHNIFAEQSIRILINTRIQFLNIPTFVVSIYILWIMCIGFIMFTGYLLFYHTMLIITGFTTWEHLRRQNISYLKYLPAGYNPFSQGLLENIKMFFSKKLRIQQYDIPTFSEASKLKPKCNIFDNQYYSCC